MPGGPLGAIIYSYATEATETTLTISLRPHQQRACDAMLKHDLGQVIVPTGGGKTICMIKDTINTHNVIDSGNTTVIVAPRILLSNQLCNEFLELIDKKYTHILHVHSGKTDHFSTTNPYEIYDFVDSVRRLGENLIIFTTYHSLHRIQQSDIEVNTIYFDEAHNSVQSNFFSSTRFFSCNGDNRSFFFTATPKCSNSIESPGMNDVSVYGPVICNVSSSELVSNGYILPPKVVTKDFTIIKGREITCQEDSNNLIETIDDNGVNKVLICSKSTKQIVALITQSDFCIQLRERGYSVMYTTSKTGNVIDGEKVSRQSFLETLNAWGKAKNKKFVVLHYSILSEGINVSGLESVLFMRNMNYIGITQTIGRVIRLGDSDKKFGLISIPVYTKYSSSISRKVRSVVNNIFYSNVNEV